MPTAAMGMASGDAGAATDPVKRFPFRLLKNKVRPIKTGLNKARDMRTAGEL
jgi:hypothetical protein